MANVKKISVTHKDGSISSKERGDRDFIHPKEVRTFIQDHSKCHLKQIKIEFC